ncbi:crossover junction endonuclease EME1 [Hyposmocoma kahamanoa]|uniref:crossover junction endonuclease EME1 n=1 Tax=Hyposmocoma kahamanoa TaxID=1477025 RepID=UPI000E6D913F|nr:crossover junction endonuclease EME1 [Hyposmocoma kahamanoa]
MELLSGVQLTPRKERCEHALYVLCADDIAEHVSQHSLAKHLMQVKDMVACAITLVIFGSKDYFKSPSRRTLNSNRKLMTEIELEMAVTDLIVTSGCDAAMVDSPNDLALLIAQFTKALAEAPYKKSKRASDEQAEFYMRGDNKQCVAIDGDGNGMSRLWQQMVAVLPLSSLETSRAICAQYKTPMVLYEALQTSNAVNTLADVSVARAAVPNAKTRRVGPEFARKLHILFTSDEGSALID